MPTDDISKLDFSRVAHFQGRKKEKQRILDVVSSSFSSPPPLVLIHGPSGTGKSTLTDQLRRSMREKGSPGPGGPTTALTNIQVHLVLRKFLQTICSAAAFLARPVVFVQDDLQWADELSLTLIKALVFGASPPHAQQPSLIFIGTYRDDEEARANTAFSEFLRSCEQDCSSANSVLLLDVSLENFGVDVVNTYLSLLHPQETTSLAMIVCEKTGGNMFYLVQFLDFLHSKAYLYYCHTAMKWNWDIIKIQLEPDFCNNSIVVNKLQLLREPVLSALKIASCLGAVFDSSVLAVCLAALKNRSSVARVKIHEIETLATKSVQQTEVDVPMILNELAVLGLVKAVEEEALHNLDNSLLGTFTFAHDRLQQAAYSLVPEGYERKRLHLIIGSSILYMDVAPSEYMQHILVVVDHLTRASDLLVDKKEKMRLSELNLEAANLVISQSAFFPALEYLNAALRQLDGLDKWGTELYSFSLETYNKLARVAYATGDFVLCKQIVDEVRFNVKCATDQCDVDITWLEALLATGKIDEAFKVGINGLKRLGIRFSTRPHLIYAIMCAIKAKRFLGGKSAEELVPTKRMMDKNMVAAMCILGNLIEAAFLSMRIEHFILMNIRSVNITLKHGGSIGSDTGHCAMGFVFANMGDFNLAFRMAEVSLEVAEMYHPSGRYDSRVCFLAYFFLFHWKRPIHEGLGPMLRAYEAGMELGDIKNASWCATSYLTIYWWCGLQLGPLLSDIAKYRQQMVDYNQKMIYLILTPFHQAIIKLVIPSENPSNLDGEYMQVESFLKDLNCEADGAIALITVYKMRLLLAYHFDDLDVAHEMSEMMQGKLIEAEGTSVNLPFVIFFKGLTALAFVRLSGKWKYRREAQSALKRMEKWVKNGAVNSYHLLLILKAESQAVKQGSRGEDVRTAFNLAIRVSGRSGFLQDKALASERAGVYHVLKNDEYHARMYLEQATVLYAEWGALAKADYLKRKFAPYLSTETLIAETLGGSTPLYIKGRARFSADATLKHRTISITAPKS